MKIVLDLESNTNDFMVENKEELKEYIEDMKEIFNKLYEDTRDSGDRCDFVSSEEHNRFYDILVFFEKYEIIGDYK